MNAAFRMVSLLLLAPCLSGCDTMRVYPMHNPQSGEQITCSTWAEPLGYLTNSELRRLLVCIARCKEQGFVGDEPEPAPPAHDGPIAEDNMPYACPERSSLPRSS